MLGAASAAVAATESTRRDASPTFWRCSAPKHFLWARRQSAVSWGFDVLEISIAAGTGADLMAGSTRRAPSSTGLSWLYSTRRAAAIHVGKSPQCRALGLGVLEISVDAGTGADVMAGGAGAAGPAPDVRHQPPGNRTYPHKNLYILVYLYQNRDNLFLIGISHSMSNLVTKTWDILGYPRISRDKKIGRDIPG